MKIWVTGIAGFIGNHLANELKRLGHDVDGNDNGICSSVKIPHLQNLDCNKTGILKNLIKAHNTNVLIHTAATAHEGLSNFSPSFITKNIYEASVSTFSAAIEAGVKRIIFFSSMARYGEQTLPFHEDMTPKPVDPYGIAKVAAEDTLKALCKLHDVEYVICVPHNVIGSGQRYWDPYRNVASIMCNRALQGKPLIVYGDGLQKRCFSPIEDCLHSLVKMIDAPIAGQTINIGPDHGEMTILDLANMINKLTGNKAGITHMLDRPNEVKEAYCTSKKAKKLLDFKPQQNIESCLKEMIYCIQRDGVKSFDYSFPIEIKNKCPQTWSKQLI